MDYSEKTYPDFSNFGELIKWPQCVVLGKKVTVDQARDILAHTDSFFFGHYGNGRFHEPIYKKIGLVVDVPDYSAYSIDEDKKKAFREFLKEQSNFRERNNLIVLKFLKNGWISNCYIGGVHGWCHPDGTIFDNQNIGKWPDWEDVYDDCQILASSFPYLDMKIYLFNQEHDCPEYYDYPKACVGGFEIKDGTVRLLEESEYLPGDSPLCITPNSTEMLQTLNSMKKELFGEGHSIDENSTFGTTENFFSEEEFEQYFKGYFGL